MRNLTRYSFGATAAIMTSMALIVGLGSANSGKRGIVGGLLIVAIADNLSDTLGIHIYEECKTEGSTAARTSVSNYVTRLLVVCSFAALVLAFPLGSVWWASIAWGGLLLSVLTYLIARSKSAKPVPEIAKHLLAAAVAVGVSQIIGSFISKII